MRVKTSSIVFYFVVIVLLTWFIASYIDIDMHNLGSCNYASWNIISMLGGN